MHDFQLYKISVLEELIFAENEKCQRVLGNSAITLADAGYQGISKKFPGATTPFKRKESYLMTIKKNSIKNCPGVESSSRIGLGVINRSGQSWDQSSA